MKNKILLVLGACLFFRFAHTSQPGMYFTIGVFKDQSSSPPHTLPIPLYCDTDVTLFFKGDRVKS